jgi:hypothetical protein
MLQEGSHNLIPEPASRCGSSYRWFHYSGDWSGRVSWELPNWISGCYTDLSSEPPKSQETFLCQMFSTKNWTHSASRWSTNTTAQRDGVAKFKHETPGFHLQFHHEFRHRATELVKLNLAGWTVIQGWKTTGRLFPPSAETTSENQLKTSKDVIHVINVSVRICLRQRNLRIIVDFFVTKKTVRVNISFDDLPIQTIETWWFSIANWLVVDPPLWKIWVRQMGWWHSQLNGKS